MATGQDLLNRIEVLNQEIQAQPGEADTARALVALNMAQDYFESLVAQRPGALGSAVGTVVTVAGTETTAFPTGVLRIDRVHLLDPSTSRPRVQLVRLQQTGGHVWGADWLGNLVSGATGVPRGYWTNGTNIYWSPLPSGVSTLRWYGFQVASDITAGGTFAYPDIVMLPLASMAVQLLKQGVDDPAGEASGMATAAFSQVLDTLDRFNRDGAQGLSYTRIHTE